MQSMQWSSETQPAWWWETDPPGGPVKMTFNAWASHGVRIGTGIKMMMTQMENIALRRCRIGMVTKKDSNKK